MNFLLEAASFNHRILTFSHVSSIPEVVLCVSTAHFTRASTPRILSKRDFDTRQPLPLLLASFSPGTAQYASQFTSYYSFANDNNSSNNNSNNITDNSDADESLITIDNSILRSLARVPSYPTPEASKSGRAIFNIFVHALSPLVSKLALRCFLEESLCCGFIRSQQQNLRASNFDFILKFKRLTHLRLPSVTDTTATTVTQTGSPFTSHFAKLTPLLPQLQSLEITYCNGMMVEDFDLIGKEMRCLESLTLQQFHGGDLVKNRNGKSDNEEKVEFFLTSSPFLYRTLKHLSLIEFSISSSSTNQAGADADDTNNFDNVCSIFIESLSYLQQLRTLNLERFLHFNEESLISLFYGECRNLEDTLQELALKNLPGVRRYDRFLPITTIKKSDDNSQEVTTAAKMKRLKHLNLTNCLSAAAQNIVGDNSVELDLRLKALFERIIIPCSTKYSLESFAFVETGARTSSDFRGISFFDGIRRSTKMKKVYLQMNNLSFPISLDDHHHQLQLNEDAAVAAMGKVEDENETYSSSSLNRHRCHCQLESLTISLYSYSNIDDDDAVTDPLLSEISTFIPSLKKLDIRQIGSPIGRRRVIDADEAFTKSDEKQIDSLLSCLKLSSAKELEELSLPSTIFKRPEKWSKMIWSKHFLPLSKGRLSKVTIPSSNSAEVYVGKFVKGQVKQTSAICGFWKIMDAIDDGNFDTFYEYGKPSSCCIA